MSKEFNNVIQEISRDIVIINSMVRDITKKNITMGRGTT